jgi:alpha-tubulin suppressor-like RCC1 family protein
MYDSGILGVRTHEQLYTDPLYKWSFIVGPPIHVPIDAFIVSVAVGGSSCIALDSTGRVWEWGTGIVEMPIGSDARGDTNSLTPQLRDQPRDVIAVFRSESGYGCFAIDRNDRLWVWGGNTNGELGLGHTNRVDEPQVVSNVPGIRSIVSTSAATLALMENGELWGWGKAYNNRINNFGEGKVGYNAPVELPRRLAHFPHLRSIMFYDDTFLAIDERFTTYIWRNAGGFQQVLSIQHPTDKLHTPRIVPGICDDVSRVEMAKQLNAVLVHPQPADDVVECVLPSDDVDVVQVFVVGLTGQRHPMDYTSEGKYLRVRTSALAPGMYALAVLTGKDVLYVQLVKR